MYARQVGPQFGRQLRVAFGPELAGQPVTGRDTAHPLHDEKRSPVHRSVFAQPERPRHLDAGTMNRAQYRELLGAAQAFLNRRLCIAAQDPALLAGMGATLDAHVQQPIFLDSAARKALLLFKRHPLRARLGAQERFKPGFFQLFFGLRHCCRCYVRTTHESPHLNCWINRKG
ncbi:hypothetical protein D3C81_1584250 [compost metagenome]